MGPEPAAADADRIPLRLAIVCALAILAALLGVWLVAGDARERASLLVFFLYSIPCEFVVSVAPHEPAVLYVAKFHAPLVVALVAGGGTLVAETINYELLQHVGATTVLQRVARARMLRWAAAIFGRAPFMILWVAGFVPVIPFTPLRVFVLLSEYPRGRYLAASVSARTARFYVVALIGAAIRMPTSAIAVLFVVLALVVTMPGAYRALARDRDASRTRPTVTSLDEDETPLHDERPARGAP